MILIKKPGKDLSKPTGYRPIVRTSNICQIIERLSYELEKKGMLAGYQSGFRKGRNIMDLVIRLETEIRKAQVNKESVIVVFFDIEKAHDMMWKKGLLIKLCKMGVVGELLTE